MQWRSNGCHLVIGEIESEDKNGEWKKKLFDLNEFRSQTGRTERTRRKSREDCLEFLRNRPLGKPLGLYGTDINRDITNGKLRKIIGNQDSWSGRLFFGFCFFYSWSGDLVTSSPTDEYPHKKLVVILLNSLGSEVRWPGASSSAQVSALKEQ